MLLNEICIILILANRAILVIISIETVFRKRCLFTMLFHAQTLLLKTLVSRKYYLMVMGYWVLQHSTKQNMKWHGGLSSEESSDLKASLTVMFANFQLQCVYWGLMGLASISIFSLEYVSKLYQVLQV